MTNHRPSVLDPADRQDAETLARLRTTPGLRVVDSMDAQLAELARSRAPERRWTDPDLAEAKQAILGAREAGSYGRWIHYPWSSSLVHLLPPEEFHELRTDRNRHKITAAEQRALRQKIIGIVGLSVGHAIALTLALEGVGGSFRLADPDTLDLSNLNRLRAPLAELGQNKALIAARNIAEIDPYVEIEVFQAGISEENCDRFLEGDGVPLDLLVEECDDLAMKVALRERAREKRIPVLMETSDRGMLDVERYDREPELQILHALLGGVDAKRLTGLSAKEKVPLALSILGVEEMSVAARASLLEIQQSVSTWPQLASAIMLGGAVTTDAARRILLGSFTQSGRFRVDLEALVRDGSQEELGPPKSFAVIPSEPSLEAPKPVARPAGRGAAVSRQEVEYLIAHALWAPSGGNAQPWRFEAGGDRIDCLVDASRAATFLDVDRCASLVAVGAAVENIHLAAAELGLRANLSHFPDAKRPELACSIALQREASAPRSELFAHIQARVSNRRRGEAHPIPAACLDAMREAAAVHGASLHVQDDADALGRIGEVIGRCDRLRFFSPRMREELLSELRWTPEEAVVTRDGLELATLEMAPLDRAAITVLSSPEVVELLEEIEGGAAIVRGAIEHLASASAAVAVTHPHSSPEGYLLGGRALQRVWLTATAHRLAVHPHGVAAYLFERLARGGLSAAESATLAPLCARFDELLKIEAGHARIMLLRLCVADPPTARSLRRPITDVLSYLD